MSTTARSRGQCLHPQEAAGPPGQAWPRRERRAHTRDRRVETVTADGECRRRGDAVGRPRSDGSGRGVDGRDSDTPLAANLAEVAANEQRGAVEQKCGDSRLRRGCSAAAAHSRQADGCEVASRRSPHGVEVPSEIHDVPRDRDGVSQTADRRQRRRERSRVRVVEGKPPAGSADKAIVRKRRRETTAKARLVNAGGRVPVATSIASIRSELMPSVAKNRRVVPFEVSPTTPSMCCLSFQVGERQVVGSRAARPFRPFRACR